MGKVLKGRVVKLVDGGKGNSLTAFKAVDGKYYSSENAYLEIKQDKEDYKKAMELIADWIGYPPGMPVNTYLIKRASMIRRKYGAYVLLETIRASESGIKWAMENREFNNDSAMINYIFTIVDNQLFGVYKTIQKEKRNKIAQENMNLPDDLDVNNATTQTAKDISRFLGDNNE